MILHFIGFASFLGPAVRHVSILYISRASRPFRCAQVIIELPCAIYELLFPSGAPSVNLPAMAAGSDEGMHLRAARSTLAVMRIICALLLVVAAPFLSKESTRHAPKGLKEPKC